MWGFQEVSRISSRGVLYAAGALAAFLPAVGHAQDRVPAQSADQATNAADTPLGEIVVTAQRREQKLNDVPLSVSAIGSGDIKKFGISDVTDLRGLVPGVEIRRSLGLGNPTITMRGVGVTTFDPIAGNTVATYFDDVPLGSTGQINFTTFDLERVEVLKGPQGTLFGSNTSAGVLQFVSKKPTDQFEAEGRLGVGNYGSYFGEAIVNAPLAPDVAGRLSVRAETSSGYFDNLATGNSAGGADAVQVRGQLLWKPVGGSILLKGYYGRSSGRSNLYDYVPLLNPATGTGPMAYCAPIQAGLARGKVLQSDIDAARSSCVDVYQQRSTSTNPFDAYHRSVYGDDPRNDLTNYGFSAHADFDLGFGSLTSITAYDRNVQHSNDPEGTGLADRPGAFDVRFDTIINQFSQELRLSSAPGSRHVWVVGGTLIHNQTSVKERIQLNFGAFADPDATPGAALSTETAAATLAGSLSYYEPASQESTDVGIFGQVDWKLLDRLTLVTGLRGSWYKKTFTASLDLPGFSFPEQANSISQANMAFRTGLNYKIDPRMMIYASVSQGVKSGGYAIQFITNPNQLPGAKQERLIAYEFGFKGQITPTLNASAATFYYDYHDMQSLTQVATALGLVQRFSNIGDARIYGAEGEITWSPVRNLLLRGSVSYLNTKITRSVDINGDGTAGDYTGNRLQSAPRWAASYLARYNIPVSDNSEIVLQYDGSYTGDEWRSIDNTPFNYTEASILHNASIGLQSRDGDWEASAWIKNIGDERTMAWQFTFGGDQRRSYIPPRTFGFTLERKFR